MGYSQNDSAYIRIRNGRNVYGLDSYLKNVSFSNNLFQPDSKLRFILFPR